MSDSSLVHSFSFSPHVTETDIASLLQHTI